MWIWQEEDSPLKCIQEVHLNEPYFIALMLQGQIVIRPTKKMVASYVVGDLALLD